jgi:plastocyanin
MTANPSMMFFRSRLFVFPPFRNNLGSLYNPAQMSYPTMMSSGYGYPSMSSYGGSGGYQNQYPTSMQSYLGSNTSQNPYTSSGSSSAQVIPAVEVEVFDGSYQPKAITISSGVTVHWKNYGAHRHTITSDTGLWDSREMDPGMTYSVTLNKPGTYPYHCLLHPERMRGVIVVE